MKTFSELQLAVSGSFDGNQTKLMLIDPYRLCLSKSVSPWEGLHRASHQDGLQSNKNSLENTIVKAVFGFGLLLKCIWGHCNINLLHVTNWFKHLLLLLIKLNCYVMQNVCSYFLYEQTFRNWDDILNNSIRKLKRIGQLESPSIHFLYPLNPTVGSRGGWSLSQRSLGKSWGTSWTGRQSIAGPHRDKRDKQPHTRAHS